MAGLTDGSRPKTDISNSITASKTRQTGYFDIVYLHDVRFIADTIVDINEEVQPTRVLEDLKYTI